MYLKESQLLQCKVAVLVCTISLQRLHIYVQQTQGWYNFNYIHNFTYKYCALAFISNSAPEIHCYGTDIHVSVP